MHTHHTHATQNTHRQKSLHTHAGTHIARTTQHTGGTEKPLARTWDAGMRLRRRMQVQWEQWHGVRAGYDHRKRSHLGAVKKK